MALGERYTKAAVFITRSRGKGSARVVEPCGTGFVVSIPTAREDLFHVYVVTAAHVVRPFDSTFVRVSMEDGSVEDLPVDKWVFHPTEDVAVTPCSDEFGDFYFSHVPLDQFVGKAETQHPPMVADDVYFIGLLGNVPSMGARNVPMVRSGSIGALYQEGIPIRLPDETVIHVGGHLIDCRSFGGFSGSPCFVRYTSGQGETERMGLQFPIESTLLLGMVAGHFDLKASAVLPDQEEKIKVPVAAGIAVLCTAEMIMETLMDEELADGRKDGDKELREQMAEVERE